MCVDLNTLLIYSRSSFFFIDLISDSKTQTTVSVPTVRFHLLVLIKFILSCIGAGGPPSKLALRAPVWSGAPLK